MERDSITRRVAGQNKKKCTICLRSFSRAEHLARHHRIHTKEKPFTCPYCHKSFQRSDVKAGHLKRCLAAPFSPPNGGSDTQGSGRKRTRVACEPCRKKKMRCDGNEPCAQCSTSKAFCCYRAAKSPPPAPSRNPDAEPGTIDYSHQTVVGPDVPAAISDIACVTPVTFASCHDFYNATSWNSGGNSAPSHNIDLTPIQGNCGTMPSPGLTGQGEMSEHENTVCEVGGNVLASENVLCHFPNIGSVDDFWQMSSNEPFWFDVSDYMASAEFDSSSSLPDHIIPSPMQELTESMQDYFHSKSRAPSPSLNKATKMWYSAPPNLADHDKDVVRVFIDIFQQHIPNTFALLDDVTVCRNGRAAFTLAMAATGGLFCTVFGSSDVAKSMYNDARRLLLASFNTKTTSDGASAKPEDKLVTVKTFILLELYGLCSGDKRSYEFTESFHGNLIEAVREYSQALTTVAPAASREMDRAQLLEALYILDCYRVIIMQCPPSLPWHHPNSFAQPTKPTDRVNQLHRYVADLTDGSRAPVPDESSNFRLGSLTCLSVFLWPVMYARQNRYGSSNVVIESLSLWKRDFVDLACDTWLRVHGQTADVSHLAVYHMLNIMVHANLTVIQSFAHSTPESPTRDPNKSLVAKEVHAWTGSPEYKFAHWHAQQLITAVEDSFTVPANRFEQTSLRSPTMRPSSLTTESRQLPFEAPHIPYSIYFATLVLWCGAIAGNNGTGNAIAAQPTIAKGERILSLHKVHIARLLAHVLSDVK